MVSLAQLESLVGRQAVEPTWRCDTTHTIRAVSEPAPGTRRRRRRFVEPLPRIIDLSRPPARSPLRRHRRPCLRSTERPSTEVSPCAIITTASGLVVDQDECRDEGEVCHRWGRDGRRGELQGVGIRWVPGQATWPRPQSRACLVAPARPWS
jgi:hypothetical protein